jgi:hypothetical protein
LDAIGLLGLERRKDTQDGKDEKDGKDWAATAVSHRGLRNIAPRWWIMLAAPCDASL